MVLLRVLASLVLPMAIMLAAHALMGEAGFQLGLPLAFVVGALIIFGNRLRRRWNSTASPIASQPQDRTENDFRRREEEM
jgi:Na+-driven multidrug efflux pump